MTLDQSADCAEIDGDVAALLALLGKRHTLRVLHIFAEDRGPWRFTDLEGALDILPTTLSARLAELTAAGFLDRRAYDERPPRVEYTGTDQAEALKPAFSALYGWTSEYGPVTD